MLRDTNIAITQHALTSERVSREVRYLSDNLEFSANAATLFLPTPVNRGFISWEDHYQFYPLESLLASNRIQKRPTNSRKPTGIKQHTCYFESPPAQELTLPPIVRNNGSTKSAGTRRIKARRSNFSVHSIPMDPSVDWVNTISSAVDNFEVCLINTCVINYPHMCCSSLCYAVVQYCVTQCYDDTSSLICNCLMILAYRNFAV